MATEALHFSGDARVVGGDVHRKVGKGTPSGAPGPLDKRPLDAAMSPQASERLAREAGRREAGISSDRCE